MYPSTFARLSKPVAPRFVSGHAFCGLIAAIIITAQIVVCSVVTANPFWERFGDRPLEVVRMIRNNPQGMTLLRFEDGLLLAQLSRGGTQASLPANPPLAEALRLVDVAFFGSATDALNIGDWNRAIEVMRPEVYPMIKFVQIPEEFGQLHASIRTLLTTLIQAKIFDEAIDLMKRIDLSKVSPAYSVVSLNLSRGLVQADRFQDAADMATRVPITGDYSVLLPEILLLARDFQASGALAPARQLYGAVMSNATGSIREEAQLLSWYGDSVNASADEMKAKIEGVARPAPGTRLFSLRLLLEASIAFEMGDRLGALDLASLAFVDAENTFPWIPDLLLLLGRAYRSQGSLTGAGNVWDELIQLYPDTPQAKLALQEKQAMLSESSPATSPSAQ